MNLGGAYMSKKECSMDDVVESKCGTSHFKKKHAMLMILIMAGVIMVIL